MSGGWSHPWLDQGWPHWEDTWGGSYQLDPVGVGEEGARRGGRSHKYGTGKTKCELGVSIGNSAFTFLLHFYFKHRKRERKQIEKKMCKKKEKKKEIKLLLFLFWQHVPFSFLSLLLVPQPQMLHQLSPHPPVPSSGVGLGQEVMRETVTGRGKHAGGQRTRDMGEGKTGRQEDHAFGCAWAPSWEGGVQLGGGLWLGGHRGGSGGTLWSPLALSAALLPEPGAQGRKLGSSRAWVPGTERTG